MAARHSRTVVGTCRYLFERGPGGSIPLPDPAGRPGDPGYARMAQNQYAGLDLDLGDAVNVALAAHYRTNAC